MRRRLRPAVLPALVTACAAAGTADAATVRAADAATVRAIDAATVTRPATRATRTGGRLIAGPQTKARTYLRFRVPVRSGPVMRATLRLRARAARRTKLEVRPALGSRRPRGLRWRTAPAVGAVAARSRAFRAAKTVRVGVTSIVAGPGVVRFALTARRIARLARRGRGAPRLDVSYGRSDAQPGFPIRAAFYYPWFPEAWRQKGVYPYTRYHPSLGYYDGSAAAVIGSHLEQLAYGRFAAAIASWDGPGTRTDRRLGELLAATAGSGSPVRWAVYVEEEGRGNPGARRIASRLRYVAKHYGREPAYLRVNGRPVVFVYGDPDDRCGMARRWSDGDASGVYAVLKVFEGYRRCGRQPDGWHQYAPAKATDQQDRRSFSVSPGFNHVGESRPRLDRDVSRFTTDVRAMVASGARWQLVTTFNEWGEGTAVEPATEWSSAGGFGAYLDVLHGSAQPIAPSSPSPSGDPFIAAAGDIACDPADGDFRGGTGTAPSCHMRQTSDLLVADKPTAVLTLGDNQYDGGALSAFLASFDPTWGRMKSMMRPVAGNHEYGASDAAGYFDYFNGSGQSTGPAGERGKGYYSYDIGAWHLIALNSNCDKVGGCNAGSPQLQWLKSDLAAHRNKCTLAYWHHPAFSSGDHGDNSSVLPLWQALYDDNADVVLNGHDHDYERFAPQTPGGQLDPVRGIREFVSGTGGRNHYDITSPKPNSEVHDTDTFGVLRLTLHASSYDWRFVPEPGKTFTDSGTGSCH